MIDEQKESLVKKKKPGRTIPRFAILLGLVSASALGIGKAIAVYGQVTDYQQAMTRIREHGQERVQILEEQITRAQQQEQMTQKEFLQAQQQALENWDAKQQAEELVLTLQEKQVRARRLREELSLFQQLAEVQNLAQTQEQMFTLGEHLLQKRLEIMKQAQAIEEDENLALVWTKTETPNQTQEQDDWKREEQIRNEALNLASQREADWKHRIEHASTNLEQLKRKKLLELELAQAAEESLAKELDLVQQVEQGLSLKLKQSQLESSFILWEESLLEEHLETSRTLKQDLELVENLTQKLTLEVLHQLQQDQREVIQPNLMQEVVLFGVLLSFIFLMLLLLKQQNQEILTFSSQPGRLFPEECVSELAKYRKRLEAEGHSTFYIECILLWIKLTLIWAFYIQIRIENIRLPQKGDTKRIDE